MKEAPVLSLLPADLPQALLVGRVWRTGDINGPSVVAVRNGEVIDITQQISTVSELFEREDMLSIVRNAPGRKNDVPRVTASFSQGDLSLSTVSGSAPARSLEPGE